MQPDLHHLYPCSSFCVVFAETEKVLLPGVRQSTRPISYKELLMPLVKDGMLNHPSTRLLICH